MTERYIATTAAGDPVVRTNSRVEADMCAGLLGGRVIDQAVAS